MEDWDADLDYAIPAAQKAAATPLTRAMLDICSRAMELPFSGSPKAMARLLDIAILTGNQKAAMNLSKKCQLRPLRRWIMDFGFEMSLAVMAALRAGADFQNLLMNERLDGAGEDVPFPQSLFLGSKLEDWQEVRHLLPQCHRVWRPRKWNNHWGDFFVECPHGPDGGCEMPLDKIRAAEDAGVDLQTFVVPVWCRGYGGPGLVCRFEAWRENDGPPAFVSLLDMAIWCGQSDCAEACVDRGIELKGDDTTLAWHKNVLCGEILRLLFRTRIYVAPSEAETAAAAAGRAWLKRSWKSESSQKGFVLYQMMLKMFKGRSFPMALAQEILTLATTVPKIIDQLDLWEHVGDWMAAICGRPPSVHPAADCNTADVEDPEGMQDNGEADDNGEAGALLYIEVPVFVGLLFAAKHQDS